MIVLRQNDRGENERSKFADSRHAKDVASEFIIEVPRLPQNGDQYAERRGRQDQRDEKRRLHESNKIKQSGNNDREAQ